MAAPDPFDLARCAWPGVGLAREAFEAVLSRAGAIPAERLGDLYLAAACAAGDAAACDVLEKSFVVPALEALARRERDPAKVDEVGQALRIRLLVGDDTRPPRIAEYAGRGALAGWVKVVTARLHADHHRGASSQRSRDVEELEALAVGVDIEAARREHRDVVERALRETLSALSRRDRTLLRMAYVEGIPQARIAAMHGVDKATVSRWLAALRGRVADEAMARAADAVGATHDEVRSLFALLASSLDVGMASLLASAG